MTITHAILASSLVTVPAASTSISTMQTPRELRTVASSLRSSPVAAPLFRSGRLRIPVCACAACPKGVISAASIRCSLSSSAGGGNCPPFVKMGTKTITVFRKQQEVPGRDVSTSAALSDEYVVSEPQKVTESSEASSDVLLRLKQGFVKFKEQRFVKETELFSQLAQGQAPKVMFVSCADSRVCPTMLMGLNPGEAFIVRNVANLVPPCEDKGSLHGTSAALEFAVTGLKVEHIIVIGHRNCGGIKALMSRNDDELSIESDFIGSWISCAIPAKKNTLVKMEGKSFADQCKYCEQEAVNVSLTNLLTFPWIKERFEAGTLGLHGMYYDFVEGELTSWEVQQSAVVAA